jgi:cell division protein FtsN
MTMRSITDDATRRAPNGQWLANLPDDRANWQDASPAKGADAAPSIPARYEVLAQVGTGGAGIVYKVRDLETGEIVALKVLKPGIASDQEMQESLRKEVCLARKVTHRNVCRIYDLDRSNGTACLSMELVEGENLLSRLRRVGPVSADETLEIARQVCAGLREAHLQGIVHRDLKPANIMLERSGVVKIMDFGIARLSQGNSQLTGTIAGTPAYMAPEQIELKPIGPGTDIYSIGLVLYEMVTGAQAFDGDTPIAIAVKQLRELPRRPSEIVPTLPAHIEAAILKCLRKDPAKRFQSVDELWAALEKKQGAKADVPGWVSLEFRVPDFKRHRVVQYGRQRVQAAGPQLATFAENLRLTSLEASRLVSDWVKRAYAIIRAQHRRAARKASFGPLAATVGLILLATFVAFGLVTKAKSHTTQTAEASFAQSVQGLASPDRKSTSLTGSDSQGSVSVVDTKFPSNTSSVVTTNEVDLRPTSAVAGEDEPSAATATPDDLSADDATPALTVKKVKAPPLLRRARPSPARSESAKVNPAALPSPAMNTPQYVPVPPPVTHETAGITNGQKSAVDRPDLSATDLQTTAHNPGATHAEFTSQQKAEASKSDLPEQYLEVGSFKDASWADKAVDQLATLGFHAVSVHKTHLWMQSYHVQVGPYATPTDIAAAQRILGSQHFESHLVK